MTTDSRVRQVIQSQYGLSDIDAAELDRLDTLDSDSLDDVELLIGFEEEFDMTIDDDDSMIAMTTVAEIVEYIDKALG